jgi:hypothetical protein
MGKGEKDCFLKNNQEESREKTKKALHFLSYG